MENLRKLQATDKQHSTIRDQLMQGQDHPAFLLDDREILYVRDDNKYFQAVLVPEKLRKQSCLSCMIVLAILVITSYIIICKSTSIGPISNETVANMYDHVRPAKQSI